MNRQEQDILNILAGGTFSGQRELAEESGYSLGVVNRCLRSLTETGYVRADGTLTQNGQALHEVDVFFFGHTGLDDVGAVGRVVAFGQ